MVKFNFIGAIGAVVIIIVAMSVVSLIRKKINNSGNETAITMLRVGDTIMIVRFVSGLIFMGIFITIALAVGSINGR